MASLRSLRKEKELLHETCIILLRQLQLGPGLTGKGPVPALRGLAMYCTTVLYCTGFRGGVDDTSVGAPQSLLQSSLE